MKRHENFLSINISLTFKEIKSTEFVESLYLSIYTLFRYIYRERARNRDRDRERHPQTFVVSQLFKVGLKPSWFYISWISYPRVVVIPIVKGGIFTYIFLHIRYRLSRVLSSCEKLLQFSLWGSQQISPLEYSTHGEDRSKSLKPHPNFRFVAHLSLLYGPYLYGN